MKLVIHGKNIKITEAIREYLHRKLKKAVRNFQNITGEINVYISMAQNPRVTAKHSAEVNILANGSVIRAEEISENLYVSINLVADKITRKLRKYKERRQRKITHARSINELIPMGNTIGDLIGQRIPELHS
ncbi:Ribosomal subunit interface protein [Richelia intracellularis HH01]|uniref:Ribosomal subunit interface protein n=1 Tax=Richelia intracellularis HH01 TaxID=1165094 RepID=M1X4Q7_9NOST|nr:Ribosomal subunit interface protein [Richelia intracellularis HH01]